MADLSLDHFTSDDRRTLTELAVRMGDIRELISKKLGDGGSVEAEFAAVERRFVAVDTRVRQLENFRYWIAGAAATLGFLAGLFGRKFGF